MTHAISFILQAMHNSPEGFRDHGNSISNGYYVVAHNGGRYGMGSAFYNSSDAEKESLLAAIQSWKKETGWSPSDQKAQDVPMEARNDLSVFYLKAAYEKFAKSIQDSFRDFSRHGESSIMVDEVRRALVVLDSALKPLEAIAGSNENAKKS